MSNISIIFNPKFNSVMVDLPEKYQRDLKTAIQIIRKNPKYLSYKKNPYIIKKKLSVKFKIIKSTLLFDELLILDMKVYNQD